MRKKTISQSESSDRSWRAGLQLSILMVLQTAGNWINNQPEWLQSTIKTGAGAYVAASGYSRLRQELVYRRVSQGSCGSSPSGTLKPAGRFLARHKDTESIKRIFSPSPAAVHSLFYYISGPPGGGKSCLVQQAASEVPEGVVCVAAGSKPSQFGQDLANAMGLLEALPNPLMLAFDLLTSFGLADSSREAKSQLDNTLEALTHAATRFQSKTGRPAVLVIDDASRLGREDFWEDMLETATQWANEGIIRTVFVSSDDALIQSISSRSRCCRTGSYEVLDVSNQEAAEFLQASGLKKPDAEEVVESVGGRLMSLVATCESLEQGATIPDIKAAWRADAEEQYQQAGLLDNSPQRESGLGVVKALLAAEASGKQGISNRLWNELVPEPADKVALLQANVFAKRHQDRRIVFENQAVQKYASDLNLQAAGLDIAAKGHRNKAHQDTCNPA
ncbi:hypothetical protein WJX74_003264 [Apatococcus lobatus]|uniref:Orc1-like AAA ATPase domain-containing protein n=2 Tax=Apatococcus TaxID=904362 RepID=A0AAW1SI39_9CHLO